MPNAGDLGDSLDDLTAALRDFARARDWEQFHTPKNLAMALAGETGELVACFQWLTPEQSVRVMDAPDTAAEIESELADVLQYLIRLADVLDVDLARAVRRKMRLNESRFPIG
jgi:NTP pyrophosphatase (non-canonical NTP hydrolase)